MKCSIYAIYNKITDSVYIGKSVSPDNRLNAHKCGIANASHQNSKIRADAKMHGIDSFVFDIIERNCNPIKENVYIKYYSKYFKMYNTAHNPNKDIKPITGRKKMKVVQIRIPHEWNDMLLSDAKAGGRSVCSEIYLIIRKHLKIKPVLKKLNW